MRATAPALLPSRVRSELTPDERLVARVRAGDARAFEAIYDRYEAPIRSFCRHLLGQPEDADDAVQHTFLAAYRSIRDGGKEIDLRPWLFTVARNRCRSLLRSRRRDPWLRGEAFEPSTEGLSAAVERRESLRDLLHDIGGLPEDQRAALILTQLDTLRHDEVARVLEVPTDKVKALVFQARSSLISTRCARETACRDIREQLATLSGPALRRGHLKRHLRECIGCRDFQLALRRQRAAIVVLLPVAATPALRSTVLSHAAGGSGAAGAGAGAGAGGSVGGLVTGGAALKVAMALTVAATGAGVAGVGTGLVSALANARPGSSQAKLGAVDASQLIALRRGESPQRAAPGGGGTAGAPGHEGGVALADDPGDRAWASPHAQANGGESGHAPTARSDSNCNVASGARGSGPVPRPPGLVKRGAPPGLAKKGSAPPGLAKKGAGWPGHAQNAPPGTAKDKKGGGSGTGAGPVGSGKPGGSSGAGGTPGAGAGGSNRDGIGGGGGGTGPGGSNGSGNGGAPGNGGGNGSGAKGGGPAAAP